MQISKYLLAAGIFVAGLSPVFAQSDVDDAEERARAREQLNQKMAELEAQLQQGEEPKPPMPPSEPVELQPAPAPVIQPVEVAPIEPKPIEPAPVVARPVEVKPVVVALPPVPQPVVKPVVVAPTAVPVQPSGEEAIARAREATRAKIAELNRASAPAPQPAKHVTQAAPKTSAPSQPAPKAVAHAPESSPMPAVTSVAPADSEAIARARAATRAKITELNAQDQKNRGSRPSAAATPAKPVATATPSATQKAAPAASGSRQQAETQAMKAAYETKAPASPTAMSLIQAPPPAVSAAKQIHLNELLGRYKADKITPEEYHAERARILAGP